MKKLLLPLLVSFSCAASNPARLLPNFDFTTLYVGNSVKLEQVKIGVDITDYIITLSSKNGAADFEWNCDFIPFLYSPEVAELEPVDWYSLSITFDDNANAINHYTVQPSGILISEQYITNHFFTLIEQVINAKSMVVTIDNAPNIPSHKYEYNVLPAMQEFIKRCENLNGEAL